MGIVPTIDEEAKGDKVEVPWGFDSNFGEAPYLHSGTIETDAKGSATFVRLAKTGFKTSCKVTKRSMIAYQTHHKQWLKSPLKEIFEPVFVFFGDCATVTVVSRYFYFLSWNAFETS